MRAILLSLSLRERVGVRGLTPCLTAENSVFHPSLKGEGKAS